MPISHQKVTAWDAGSNDAVTGIERTYDNREPAGQAVDYQAIDYQAKALYATSDMTEHQLLLLSATSPAFALSTKQWSQYSSPILIIYLF